MPTLKKSLLLLPTFFLLVACHTNDKSTGPSINKTIETTSILHGLTVGGPFQVKLVQGNVQQVKIHGPQNLIEKMTLKEKNGVLSLNFNHLNNINNDEIIDIDATLPNIDQLIIAGAGTYDASEINADKLSLEIAGAYTVNLNGQAKELNIKQAGASTLNSKSLKANKVTLENAGAGSSEIFASNELELRLAGVGHITYYGHPKTVHQEGFTLGGVNTGA